MAEKRKVTPPESRKKGSRLKEEASYPFKRTPHEMNLWGIAGRQEIMGMRRLWQLRIPQT